MAVFLVCEGEPNGIDDRVLDRLVIQPHGLNVRVTPIGGGSGLGAVRTYLARPKPAGAPPDVAIYVRDRDYFRPHAVADAGWGNAAAREFTWRRHEIENYLLHPGAILALFDNYQATEPWAAGLPTTEPDVLALLQTISASLLENHAAEVLKAELIGQANTAGLRFSPATPNAPAGSLMPGQVQWVPTLQQEATRLVTHCNAAAAHANFDPAGVPVRYAAHLGLFTAGPFLATGDFLRDMGGHELMRGLANHLRGVGAPAGMTEDFLADELLQSLASIYQSGNTFQPDDFQQLATILGQYPP